jgi:sugar-specific transcriptional regulator TrmB
MTPTERREGLLAWMRERPAHSELTATEIANAIGEPYGQVVQGRYDHMLADLKVLADRGLIKRQPGRPARWTVR